MHDVSKQSAFTGLAAGAVAGGAFGWYMLRGESDSSVALAGVASVFVGGTVAFGAGLLVFLFRKFPSNAKIAVIVATGVGAVFSGILLYGASEAGDQHDIRLHIFTWCLVWPLGFASSLWVDVKRTVAKKVVDHLNTRPD